MRLLSAFPLLLLLSFSNALAAGPPSEWVDATTGHRVVRLSSEPGTRSLYFHQNSLTPDGRYVIVETPAGIGTIEFATRRNRLIVPGKVHALFQLFRRVFDDVRFVDYEDLLARPVETYARMAALGGLAFDDPSLAHTKLNSLSNRLLLANPIQVACPGPARRRP